MNKQNLHVMWFVPPAIAVAASWKAKPGFVLETSGTQSSDEQFRALLNGRVDAVVTSMDNVIHWNHRPGPRDFVVVAQVEATTPLCLVGARNIKGVHDLKGANILVDASENGFVIALRAMLDNTGLMFGDYSLTSIGGVKERFSALVEGKGDATLLGPPFDCLAIQQGLSRLASVQTMYPEFPGQGVVVRKMTAEKHTALETWITLLFETLKTVPGSQGKIRDYLFGQGIPGEAIELMIKSLPKVLVPDARGVNLLIKHRKQLGLMGCKRPAITPC